MISYLRYSIRNSFDPENFMQYYKDENHQTISSMIQQDASEYLITIMDRLENGISKINCCDINSIF